MAGRYEWLGVWAASYAAFVFDHETYVQTAAYGAALVVVIVATIRRSRTARWVQRASATRDCGQPRTSAGGSIT
jgi:hypothetical protein